MFNFRKIYDYISSSGSERYNFLHIGFLFADFEFRSLRTNLSRPKLPRFSTMFHICLLFNLIPETDSCIFPTSLSTDSFCLEISFQNFWFVSFSANQTNWSFLRVHRDMISLDFVYISTKLATLHLRSRWQSTQFFSLQNVSLTN